MSAATGSAMRVAVPSDGAGGLEAPRSRHFGKAESFTVAEIEGGRIGAVRVVEGSPHRQGGCMIPVFKMARLGVKHVVVDHIGKRPLSGFGEVGIAVYAGSGETVADALTAFAQDQLLPLDPDETCRGHGNTVD